MSDPRQITPAEFQLVEILWETSASLTVSQVREALDNGRRPAYTTVMTLLDKLARKGSLSRVKKGKAYHYRPAVDRDAVLRHLLGQFADAYFGGEVHTIQRFLAGEPLRSRTSGAASRKGRPRRLKETGEPPSSKNEGEMDVVLLCRNGQRTRIRARSREARPCGPSREDLTTIDTPPEPASNPRKNENRVVRTASQTQLATGWQRLRREPANNELWRDGNLHSDSYSGQHPS